MVAHTLTGNGCNASEDGTGRGTPIVTQPTRGVVLPIGEVTARQGAAHGSSAMVGADGDPMFTLSSKQHGVLTYDACGNGDGAVVNTLAGDHQNRVTDYTAIVLRNREGKPGGGKGPLLSAERSLTRASANDQVLFTVDKQSGASSDVAPTLKTDLAHQMGPVVANTVTAREHKGWNPARDVGNGAVQSGIPRRLMPIECERLMGWPDHHTAHGVAEDGTRYALSDTARYRLCGNGVASPVAGWIAWRLRWALEAQATPVRDDRRDADRFPARPL